MSPSSLARPIWVPAPGTSLAADGGGGGCQAGRVAMPRRDSLHHLHCPTASGSTLLGEGGLFGGQGCQGDGKPPAAPMLAVGRSPLALAPRGACSACGGAAAWPRCGGLWSPRSGGPVPRTVLSKTPPLLCRDPLAQGRGLTTAKRWQCRDEGDAAVKQSPWSWQGYFWAQRSAPRSGNRGRSSTGHRYRCLAPPSQGVPLHFTPQAKLPG